MMVPVTSTARLSKHLHDQIGGGTKLTSTHAMRNRHIQVNCGQIPSGAVAFALPMDLTRTAIRDYMLVIG